MENFENVKRSKKEMITNNLIGGVAWGLGATIGVSIILTVWGFILNKINLVPFVGNFVLQINDFVLQNSTKLIK